MDDKLVYVHRLTKLDFKELENTEGLRFEEQTVPDGSHGEVTLFTAIFSMSALLTLAAYLLRKHEYQTFEETIEIHHTDGRIEKRTIKWNSKKIEAPEADIIRQIRGSNPLE